MKIVVMGGQEAKGKRQKARGSSEEGLGDFTFLYTDWFYCVHLLTNYELRIPALLIKGMNFSLTQRRN
ncbi:hypothetical protein QHH03_24575, partial [Aphanizomenon sp. 202]|nr:hypothetical protein [Aphanizomenon sp. 202]